MKVLSFSGLKTLQAHHVRLVSALTPARLWNLLILNTSYLFSVILKKPFHRGRPYAVSLEPTTACNLKCPECPTGAGILKRQGGSLDLKHFEMILSKLPHQTFYLTLYFQGEPYLNRHFFNMVKLAKEKRMFVSTSTNGHFLDGESARNTIKSGLDKIILSLDGADAQTYLNYRRGGDFNKVIAGIRILVRLRKEMRRLRPLIEIQFLVFKQNEDQLARMKKLCRKLGADVLSFKTAQHYDFVQGNPYMTSVEKYSRYRKTQSGGFELKNKLRNRCKRMWSSCVITWDGEMTPCCYDKDATHGYGNLLQHDFEELWKGSEAVRFRRSVLSSRNQIAICCNCHE